VAIDILAGAAERPKVMGILYVDQYPICRLGDAMNCFQGQRFYQRHHFIDVDVRLESRVK
jgi:hypothetical protein